MYLYQIAAALVPGHRYNSIAFNGILKRFKIAANLGGYVDYVTDNIVFVNLMQASRGFNTVANPANTPTTLDTNGYPTTDFGVVLPIVPYNAAAQTLKGYIGGSGTLSISGTGYSLANVLVTGDNTTFDINIAAGAAASQATITLSASKRTAAGATNTGCTAFLVKQPGYSIADTTVYMPNFLTFIARFSTLRFMDWEHINGDLVTINVADRASDTKVVLVNQAGYPRRTSIEDAVRLCNTANRNLWWNIPAAASDALVTAYANYARDNLAAGLYTVFELGNENWNTQFAQHGYFMNLAMSANNGFSYQYSSTRQLLSATRSGTTVTVTTSIAHGYTATQVIGMNAIGNFYGNGTIATVPTTTTFTFDDGGANGATTGALALGGGSSCMALNGTLNTFDQSYDQFANQRRMYARRTVQASALISTSYGANFGSIARVGYFNQPGTDHLDAMKYVAAVHGAPSSYLYAIGEASYFFFDASAYGGANLRNVATYGGNTPPSIADYNAALTLTAANAKVKNADNYDNIASTARLYGLKLMQYEFGPDITGSPVGTAGAAAATQKLNALFDPSFIPVYKTLLSNMEATGFEEVALYSAGASANVLTSTSEYDGWGIATSFLTASARTTAVDQYMAQARTGPTRNMLAAVGTQTVVNGGQYAGHYVNGQNPNGVNGAIYLVTAPFSGTYSIVLNVDALDNIRTGTLIVNGVQVGTYTFSAAGTNLNMPAISAALTAGTNVISFGPGTAQSFTQVLINSISFT